MKKAKSKFINILTTLLLVLVPLSVLTPTAKAASLTDIHGGSYSTGATANIVMTFSVVTAMDSSTEVEIIFDDDVTASGTLTTGDVSVALSSGSGTLGTWTIDSVSDGYVKASAGGTTSLTVGGSDVLEFTIGNAGGNQYTLTSTAGNYNISVSTENDSGAGLIYMGDENDVTVTATVPPTIDMEIYDNETDGTLQPGNPNTCAIGVLTLSTVKSCDYWIGTATNSSSGLTVMVEDTGTNDGLNKGDSSVNDDLIDDVTGSPATLTAGTETYGMIVSDVGSYTVDSAFGGGTPTYEAVPTTESALVTRTSIHNTIGTNNPGERFQVTHSATMDASTEVGSYTNNLTYTAYTL